MARRKAIDWHLVGVHYRAGVRSLKHIGLEFGVSDAGIIKAAKREGWTRDLAAQIRAKADAKVNAAVVSAEVSATRTANQQVVVEVNAQLQYRVRLEHRKDIQRTRKLFQALLSEQEALVLPMAPGMTLIEQLMLATEPPPEAGTADGVARRAERARKLASRLTSGPGRIESARKLTGLLEVLIRLEREAFGIDERTPTGPQKSVDWDNVSQADAIEAYRRLVGGHAVCASPP